MSDQQDVIGQKLIKALQTSSIIPGGLIAMGFWLSKHLTVDELDFLSSLEKKLGDEACNKWLVSVMVSSGLYESEDGENVQLKRSH